MKVTSVALLSALFTVNPVLAGENERPAPHQNDWQTTLGIDVTYKGHRQSELESCLSRQFRQLGDVTLVSKHPEYMVEVVAVDQPNNGIAAAIVLSSPRMFIMPDADSVKKSEDSLMNLLSTNRHLTEDSVNVLDIVVSVRSSIREMCSYIAATIDANHFERARRSMANFNRLIGKN